MQLKLIAVGDVGFRRADQPANLCRVFVSALSKTVLYTIFCIRVDNQLLAPV